MFHIHGFFITINSMILYFKHIVHIDDFPLNGHLPSIVYVGKINENSNSNSDPFDGGLDGFL